MGIKDVHIGGHPPPEKRETVRWAGDFPAAKYPRRDEKSDNNVLPQDRALAQVERAFTYHPPQGDQPARYVALREGGMALAQFIVAYAPPSREQSLALTKLEECIMWANAAIARNE